MKNLIVQAGNILKNAFSESQSFTNKERGHLLSKYDIEIHNLISSKIQQKHPDHTVYSEEGLQQGPLSGTSWILDPIDGTTCFIFGEPFFSISLARLHNNTVVEAHVYNPVSSEYYFSDALLGKSFLNDKPIHTSDTNTVEDSLCAFGYSTNIDKINACYRDWKILFDNCRKGIAWVGPALSICNVARGRIDMFIDSDCSMFGQAAAALVLKNAGGTMYNYNKTDYDFSTKGGVFTNGKFKSLFQ
jgi:myo-inositol-1(or 4)-monophosphatase